MSHASKDDTIVGPIRINSRKHTDAYVDNPGEGFDILIESVNSRTQALEGDVVRVKINEYSQWKIRNEIIVNKWDEWSEHLIPIIENIDSIDSQSTEDSSPGSPRDGKFKVPSNLPSGILRLQPEHVIDLPFASRFLQKTGIVVEIVKRKNHGIAGGFLRSYNQRFALFSPTDYRVPRMLIKLEECPLGFETNSSQYKETLFIAKLDHWTDGHAYARGSLVKIVGDSNQVQSHIEAVLMEHQIYDTDFPQDVYEELTYVDQINQSWFDQQCLDRRDLRDQCILTIDPKTARDLDDAVSIKMIGDDTYEVGVHIADVSFFVKEMTAVDYHARLRTTSVYLVDRVIPMLPRVLCENMCSLNPGEPKLTFSVIWKLDSHGRILDEWFGRTVIKTSVKLAYEQAQSFIENPGDVSWIEEGSNMPRLYSFDWDRVSESICQLNRIAKNLREKRFDEGALRIDQVKLKYELDPQTGYPTGFSFETRQESNMLIEEFMLLANMAVAKRLYSFSDQLAYLRRHPPSPLERLKSVKEFCDAKNCPLDISNSHSIQRSLNSITDPTISKVVSHLLLRAMKNAEYICAGSVPQDGCGIHHFALNVPFYTHFTSPIRRYADIIVHRQLGLALGYEQIARSFEDIGSLTDIANECTMRKVSSKLVSDLSQKLYFNLFVQKAGFCELLACVTKIYDQSFDVILIDYDRTGRVYLDRVKDHLVSQKFESFSGVKLIELVWKQSASNRAKKKKKKKWNKLDDPDQKTSRYDLEFGGVFCSNENIPIREPQGNKQIIEVFDVIRVIVTLKEKDIATLNIDLKVPCL